MTPHELAEIVADLAAEMGWDVGIVSDEDGIKGLLLGSCLTVLETLGNDAEFYVDPPTTHYN